MTHGAGRLRCKSNGSSEPGGADEARAAGLELVLAGGREAVRAIGSDGGRGAALARRRGLGTRVTGRSPAGNASRAASFGTGGGSGAIRTSGFTAAAGAAWVGAWTTASGCGGCGWSGVFRVMGLTIVVGGGTDVSFCATFGNGGWTTAFRAAGIGMLTFGLLAVGCSAPLR